MSTNKAFWRRWLGGSKSHPEAASANAASADPLEEGLADLKWSEEEKSVMPRLMVSWRCLCCVSSLMLQYIPT